jgi:hypothetical protein
MSLCKYRAFLLFIVYYLYQQMHTHIYIYYLYNTKLYSNIYPTRCNVTQFIIPGNCSTCFGWYLHPSSGAHINVSTASGICQTVTESCISEFSKLGNTQERFLSSRMQAVLSCGNTKKRIECEASRRYALRTTDDA